MSKFVGETEKNVRDLFADAENEQRTRGKRNLCPKWDRLIFWYILMLSCPLLFRGRQ